MDPANNNTQGSDQNLQKLEEDLKSLEKEAVGLQQPSIPTPSVVPIAQPAAPVPVTVPPVETPIQQPLNNSTGSPKRNSLMLVAIILVVVALLATIAYVFGMQFFGKSVLPTSPQACTTEAKICPDGSSVGREGPNCDFAACPTVIETPTDIPTPISTTSGTPTLTPVAFPTSSSSAMPAGY